MAIETELQRVYHKKAWNSRQDFLDTLVVWRDFEAKAIDTYDWSKST